MKKILLMKKILQEGGNLILHDETGGILGVAEKIDFTSLNRGKFLKDFREFFLILDQLHKEKFQEPIWPNKNHFYTGKIFNGSAEFLFCNKIDDQTFSQYKPTVGDVDITVPESREDTVRIILEVVTRKEGEITSGIEYVGHKESKDQILFLFQYNTGEKTHPVQVDFEFVEYEDSEPTEFEQFVHNASWADIKQGLRGSLHKILIQAVAKGSSQINHGKVITPKRGNETTAKRHRDAAIFSFSVPEGLRIKYKPEKSGAYRYVPASEANRVQDVSRIFKLLFKSEPSKNEIKKFNSFSGTLDLMEKHYNKSKIESVFKIYMQKILHRDFGMTIDRRMVEDQIPKERSIEIFIQKFNFLEKYEENIKKMKQVFYNTTVFKQEGDLEFAIEQYME